MQPVLPSWSEQPPPAGESGGGTLSARDVAYDPVTHLLWYAETHDAIHSIDLQTGSAGPSMGGFADVGVVGCSVVGNARAIVLDLKRRHLIVPELTGAVLIYEAGTLKLVGGLGPAVFGDVVLGGFRHMAVDPSTGNLWWAAANGDLVEYDLDRNARTGRVITTAAAPGARGNAFRSLQIDPSRNLLIYQESGDRLQAVDLDTLAPVPFAVPASGFARFAYAPAP